MDDSRQSDRQRLLTNASKKPDLLTKEAYEGRIVELQVEVAKRQEMIGALEERVKGLKKCISAQEDELIKFIQDPKEGHFTSIQVNQAQLIDVKRSQEEMKDIIAQSLEKMTLLTDMASALSREGNIEQQPKNEKTATANKEPEKDKE